MPDGTEHEPPQTDWQAECTKAQRAAECFRQLYLDAMAQLADMRVNFTLAQQEKRP